MALELSEAARELVLAASQGPALGLDPPLCERWGTGRCCARRHWLGQLRVAPPSLSPVVISAVEQRRNLLTSLSKVAQHERSSRGPPRCGLEIASARNQAMSPWAVCLGVRR